MKRRVPLSSWVTAIRQAQVRYRADPTMTKIFDSAATMLEDAISDCAAVGLTVSAKPLPPGPDVKELGGPEVVLYMTDVYFSVFDAIKRMRREVSRVAIAADPARKGSKSKGSSGSPRRSRTRPSGSP